MNPGSVVTFRNREWIVLPSANKDTWCLRPLVGTDDDAIMVSKELSKLLGYDLPFERIKPASFPFPHAEGIGDAQSTHLFWQAVRLSLREGAAPFRSLGRISIRPRIYQFVPLLMALRLNPVRLFIADDVGVGKTIEALLVARELYDRGEIRRFCVLCPPYLCEQWAAEIAQKFNLEPVVIRSGTVSQLERQVPPAKSIYEYFPVQVASIDFVKTDRNRHQFLQFCPELVIVDEVHGAAESQRRGSQQERHALLKEVAKNPERHLILLTATPHSGIEESFRSLLGFLKPEFAQWNIANLREEQRDSLAKHFVQRTRADILSIWEKATLLFPKRVSTDETYELSESYRELFKRTYEFCSEIVQTGEGLEERKRRIRYWGALALLRCVMSSPAASVAALKIRAGIPFEGDEELEFSPFVLESDEDRTDDETPTPPVEATELTLPETDRRRLRQLLQLAERLINSTEDSKLHRATEIVRNLLQEGFHPILWCRYVATAEYVAKHLHNKLTNTQVVCVTGRMPEEERRIKIEEIDTDSPRVLVATDCLSEGINLQQKFTAVVHYDLPWNPNRLEQREGRVDRFGQTAGVVKVIRFFGRNNPVDGAVIKVLLDKAQEIHRTLGTYVPVPEESESVFQAVLEALFLRQNRGAGEQLVLELDMPAVISLHDRWKLDAQREKINRTKFAQRALKPEEVQRELEETDKVLGDPEAVRNFMLFAAQRVGLTITPDRRSEVFRINLSPSALMTIPDPIRLALPVAKDTYWRISFESPTPQGAEYLGRNHRFVAALARFLMEEALNQKMNGRVSRCGAIRTSAVDQLTSLILLGVRYLFEQPQSLPLLSEEVLVFGWQGSKNKEFKWLEDAEAQRLLTEARPEANIPLEEKRELVQLGLEDLGNWEPDQWGIYNKLQSEIKYKIALRAQHLEQSHKRIRQAAHLRIKGLEIKPQYPPDLLGILILQPVVES